MRALLISLLLLTASCRQEAPVEPGNEARGSSESPLGTALQTFRGAGKDRLCIGGASAPAAIVTYAPNGRANCSASGRIESEGSKLFFLPREDRSCRIEIRREGDNRLILTGATASCAYYCGPGASLQNKTFDRMDNPEPVTDIAGDPLC